eukprot:CAMPEP_0182559454 /NCGR_PEP_ID=MMETSP1324-20130603/2569_1 /TAXON_ID=236786 /ORGANISM="Florenciella sp., Strain RCC1587" /LENGTH=950 /DNA_ID=CAMNT_0024771715 /DNA_START=30 /DNA_END=2882 /DNA_ORIENTATION=+
MAALGPDRDQGGMEEGAGLTVSSMIKEIQGLKDKFKDEDVEVPSPFQDLEKATVLQECRCFHEPNIEPRKCATLITKMLHIVTQGEALTSTEVTDVFFGVTKLFQSQDPYLRRMMYLFIKEVAETCNPDDVIIVTSSLTKDMNSNDDLYRANAIRVLARIIDTQMLGAIERYIKQAIVDKNTLVASSALVSGIRLHGANPESAKVVCRWVNEVQEAVSSPNDMVQFHALSLLYEIKKNDRLAISKMVTQLTKSNMGSPLGVCLLIRYISKILNDDASAAVARMAQTFLESSLRHRSEIVIYEAAKAICTLDNLDQRDLNPAITVLQLFLSSPKPTLRYAAMRCLSEVSMRHPMAIVKCNDDMEALISDPNRSIATLAITTLLKTGSESSVDRLMKQINSFMNEIADEFKVVVVTAIRQLCLKYPQKHRVLVGFLAATLREEGGFEFKKAITDSIVELMHAIPETKESSLLHLCEFIEDCEFTALSTQILHLIGSLGPTTQAPARYIRFIYNRVILENAQVRAASISALSRFASQVPGIRRSVCVLLSRSLLDEDDEVRDRATVALAALDGLDLSAMKEDEPMEPPLPGEEEEEVTNVVPEKAAMLLEPLPMSFAHLEKAVKLYAAHGGVEDGQPLSIDALPVVEEPVAPVAKGDALSSNPSVAAGGAATTSSGGLSADAEVVDAAAAVYAIPELGELGRVFRSCAPVELTESETEYVVKCVKHILDGHVVLQFDVTNTIAEQQLVDVSMKVENSEPELYDEILSIKCDKLVYGVQGSCFVVLARNPEAPISHASFNCELEFRVVEVDPDTGDIEGDEDGFEENYPVETLDLNTADYMAKVSLGDFRRAWETTPNDCDVEEKFALQQFKKLEDAVENVIEFLGMQPCDGSDKVQHAKKGAPHPLYLSGKFVGNVPVLVRAMLQLDSSQMILRICVRSQDEAVSRMVADCIR